ncbi:MAG: polyprenyl synthetase family protein [Clostridiales bacterium]|nr:polyprenyl synthetase family protein [Clostridiales bacterium]
MSAQIEDFRALTEAHLAAMLPKVDGRARTLEDAMRYTLSAPGKRLRPVLLLLSCDFLGGDVSEALPFACAIEYVHTYSLIHDDLPAMDDDDLRRGVPTNHKVFGEGIAILAGDGLLSAAFERIAEDLAESLGDPERLRRHIRAGARIAAACGCRGMVAGQIADMEAEGQTVSVELLDFIHRNKTAALFRAAAAAGACLAGASEDAVSWLSLYGESLGLAFQIMDDLLDAEGDAAEMGKAAGMDAKLRKATWPALYGADASREQVRALTARAKDALLECPGNDGARESLLELAQSLEKRIK